MCAPKKQPHKRRQFLYSISTLAIERLEPVKEFAFVPLSLSRFVAFRREWHALGRPADLRRRNPLETVEKMGRRDGGIWKGFCDDRVMRRIIECSEKRKNDFRNRPRAGDADRATASFSRLRGAPRRPWRALMISTCALSTMLCVWP